MPRLVLLTAAVAPLLVSGPLNAEDQRLLAGVHRVVFLGDSMASSSSSSMPTSGSRTRRSAASSSTSACPARLSRGSPNLGTPEATFHVPTCMSGSTECSRRPGPIGSSPVFDPAPINAKTLPAGLAEYRQPFEGYDEVLFELRWEPPPISHSSGSPPKCRTSLAPLDTPGHIPISARSSPMESNSATSRPDHW
jgi:hypothetical protein